MKISNVGIRFLSLNKVNNLLPKLLDFAEIFRFARSLHVQIREKPILKTFGDGKWEKESIIDVQCRQENLIHRVHRSSGKLGKPRFLLERWTLVLGLSCLHWTQMMGYICLTHPSKWYIVRLETRYWCKDKNITLISLFYLNNKDGRKVLVCVFKQVNTWNLQFTCLQTHYICFMKISQIRQN